MLILEEAAYVDPSFFYVSDTFDSIVSLCQLGSECDTLQETVAPLTIVGNTSLLAISTLTSEINFYT